MNKFAIIIYGPPGSGKGTQANLLAWVKGFIHFDSGKYLRAVLHDPAEQHKKVIRRERALNDAGILNTPSWVLGLFKRETERIYRAGMSIVYSGSPRTIYEAFGDKKTPGLVTFLKQRYGKQNIRFFELKMPPEAAGKRNVARRTCVVCGTSILGNAAVAACPICAGELQSRRDDKPELITTRIAQYEERTFPIVTRLKKDGYRITVLDAGKQPFEIHQHIVRRLDAQGT